MIPSTMPWYRSQVIWAAIVSILSKVFVLTGLSDNVAPEDQEQLVNLIVLVAGGVADIWAMRSRIVQRYAPQITAKDRGY
jgi:hypothetical protein